MKTDFFQSCGHWWVFQICWHIECSTFTASSFRIWNSSGGIPSTPLALLVVMLPKAHLTSHSRMSGSGWVITPSWLSGSYDSFIPSFSRNCHSVLLSGCINSHSSSVLSPPFIVCRFFDDGHSDWYEVITHCSFDLHFSNNQRCWAFFMCLLAICMPFLEKCLFRSSANFLIGLFFGIELHELFVYFGD